MSITGELRKYVQDWRETPNLMDDLDAGDVDGILADFEHIADRIDAEHQKAIRELNNLADASVLLPVDADGVPIRVGDVLTDDAEFKSEGKVVRLMLENEGWMVGFGCGGWTEPSIHEWHHYHAPTVEDVLTEFGIDWEHESDCEDRAALLKEYAAKLRLADEKE